MQRRQRELPICTDPIPTQPNYDRNKRKYKIAYLLTNVNEHFFLYLQLYLKQHFDFGFTCCRIGNTCKCKTGPPIRQGLAEARSLYQNLTRCSPLPAVRYPGGRPN
jgi:hypothetical protein